MPALAALRQRPLALFAALSAAGLPCAMASAGLSVIHSTDLDLMKTALCLAVVVALTIFLEMLVEKLEETCEAKTHYAKILTAIEKELMILGIISFSLFMFLEFDGVGKFYTGTQAGLWIICFEFAHVLIFVMALFYIVNAIVSMTNLHHTQKGWDRCSNMSVPDLELNFNENKHGMSWSRDQMTLGKVFFFLSQPMHDVEFRVLKAIFIREYGLSLEFDFSFYARMCFTDHIVEGIDISIVTWSSIFSTLMMFYFAESLGKSNEDILKADGTTATDTGDRRRLGGGGGAATAAHGPNDCGGMRCTLGVFVFTGVGFLLLFGQSYILLKVRKAVRTLIENKLQLKRTAESNDMMSLPEFLEKIDQANDNDMAKAKADGKNNLTVRSTHIMAGAAKVMNKKTNLIIIGINEVIQVLNCFYLAYWLLHMLAVLGGTGWSTFGQWAAGVLMLLPALMIMFKITPHVGRYAALLDSVLHKKEEVIAEVEEVTERMDAQVKKMRTKLLEHGMRDIPAFIPENEKLAKCAELLFSELDRDSSGDLSKDELRVGLNKCGYRVSKHVFARLLRIVDPDQSGKITMKEFSELVTNATSEQLLSGELELPPPDPNRKMSFQEKRLAEIRRKKGMEASEGEASVAAGLALVRSKPAASETFEAEPIEQTVNPLANGAEPIAEETAADVVASDEAGDEKV